MYKIITVYCIKYKVWSKKDNRYTLEEVITVLKKHMLAFPPIVREYGVGPSILFLWYYLQGDNEQTLESVARSKSQYTLRNLWKVKKPLPLLHSHIRESSMKNEVKLSYFLLFSILDTWIRIHATYVMKHW